MRTLLPLFLIAIIFSSCSFYQYATVTGENIKKDDKNQFVAETDTVRITYNFNGKKGPVRITVFNKSDIPLLIDWKRSALIIGEKTHTYYQPAWNIDGSMITSTTQFFPNTNNSTIQANITGKEGLEFLPPHASIERVGMVVKAGGAFELPADAAQEKIVVQGFAKKIKKETYKKDSSPMSFRSFLTFVNSNNPDKIFTTDHGFYVSELMQTLIGPAVIWNKPEKPGDTFVVTGTYFK